MIGPLSPCPRCGAYDGMHWHDCTEYPIDQWAGIIGPIRTMTPEEIAKEYPGASLPDTASDTEGKK